MVNQQNNQILNLASIARIGSIPLVGTGFKHAEHLYGKVKNNNRLFNWYFGTAEATIFAAYETVQPAVKLLEIPLKRLDTVMCKSLDLLEQRLPIVYLPPEMMYWNTKEYMSDHLVKPMLKRADSVKQLGNAVLDHSLTNYAADRIDGAFTAGDKLVDKYLIPLQDQNYAPVEEDNVDSAVPDEKGAIKAIHHGQRFSRKLKRRLTQRTIAEARALKKQSKEAIHILIYAIELMATDPKLALQKAKELWEYLSKDEPENQERPVSLEQLIVLLTRESVRRFVHLINFSANVAATLPRQMTHTSTEIAHYVIHFNNRLIHVTKLDKLKTVSKEEAQTLIKRMLTFYGDLQGLTAIYLERLAVLFAGRIQKENTSGSSQATTSNEATNISLRRRLEVHENNTQESHNNVNGVY